MINEEYKGKYKGCGKYIRQFVVPNNTLYSIEMLYCEKNTLCKKCESGN